ncbi:MAG: 30S ribosomal protein S4 [Nanoarchaeota archaeon]
MGDIKRKKSKFKRPKKPYDKKRIEEENLIIKKYGLKNKKEIWKAEAEVSKIRRIAKSLISKSDEEKNEFFNKLKKMGFNINKIADVLALTTEDWLNRRLQTFVFQSKLANSPKEARQKIVHKKVLVNNAVVNIPSFMVDTEFENKITIKQSSRAKLKEEVSNE